MDEPRNEPGQIGSSKNGSLLEGADYDVAGAGDPPSGNGVQTFRAEPSSSPGVERPNFDMLASLDEPEQFVTALKVWVEEFHYADPKWKGISAALQKVIDDHERANQPSAR
jgi:hypothetical protein